jgi:AraC-like DNA-binding protein
MKKPANIPVYDICTLNFVQPLHEDVIARPLALYLDEHPNLHFPHRHSFYHLVLFTQGCGSHTIDFEEFPVLPGQLYFMSPGQVHGWNFEPGVDGYIINFSEDLFRHFLADRQYLDQFAFMHGLAGDCVIPLSSSAFTAITAVCRQLVAEVSVKTGGTKDILRSLLLQLMLLADREQSGSQTRMPQQARLTLYQFRKLVDEYYAEKRLPKEYAAMLYITPNHLNALCSELLGKPAGELIRDRVLLEAKRLLVNAGLSIAEIAYQLNFADNSYFTKFFKKYTGQTPEDFRKTSVQYTSKK